MLHFDYALGLPRLSEFFQMVFAVYQEKQAVYKPVLVEPKDCEVQDEAFNQCLLGESHLIHELSPAQDTMLIIEL